MARVHGAGFELGLLPEIVRLAVPVDIEPHHIKVSSLDIAFCYPEIPYDAFLVVSDYLNAPVYVIAGEEYDPLSPYLTYTSLRRNRSAWAGEYKPGRTAPPDAGLILAVYDAGREVNAHAKKYRGPREAIGKQKQGCWIEFRWRSAFMPDDSSPLGLLDRLPLPADPLYAADLRYVDPMSFDAPICAALKTYGARSLIDGPWKQVIPWCGPFGKSDLDATKDWLCEMLQWHSDRSPHVDPLGAFRAARDELQAVLDEAFRIGGEALAMASNR